MHQVLHHGDFIWRMLKH